MPYINIGLIYGRYLQFRILEWPLIRTVPIRLVKKTPFPRMLLEAGQQAVQHSVWKKHVEAGCCSFWGAYRPYSILYIIY